LAPVPSWMCQVRPRNLMRSPTAHHFQRKPTMKRFGISSFGLLAPRPNPQLGTQYEFTPLLRVSHEMVMFVTEEPCVNRIQFFALYLADYWRDVATTLSTHASLFPRA
jgi:hypothetical protein